MIKLTLRPDKYYSVTELSKVLRLAPFDLFNLINRSGIIFELIDDQAVYKGSEIQPLIDSISCINPDISPFTGMS